MYSHDLSLKKDPKPKHAHPRIPCCLTLCVALALCVLIKIPVLLVTLACSRDVAGNQSSSAETNKFTGRS